MLDWSHHLHLKSELLCLSRRFCSMLQEFANTLLFFGGCVLINFFFETECVDNFA
jgi:hypothetical protein